MPARVRRFATSAPAPLVAAGTAIGLVFAVPVGYLAVRALGDDLITTLRAEHFAEPLSRTLVLAAAVAGATSVLGTALAWLVVRTDLPGRRILRTILPLPLVFPSFVGAFCFLAAFTDGGLVEQYLLQPLGVDGRWRIEGFGWSVAVLTLFTYPYVYLPVAARLGVLPPSLEESARSLGRTPVGTFSSVVLPQSTGAIGAGALLVFLYSLSEFGAVALLRYDTLTRSIYTATQSFDTRTAFALSLVLALCAFAVIAIERRWAERRVRTEATGADRTTITYRLGRWKAPATAFVLTVVALSLGGPIAVLVQWTGRGIVQGSELHAERLLPAAINTAGYGIAGAVIAIAVVLPVAYLTVRHPGSVVARATNAIVTSTFALPGLIIGFVFVHVAQVSWIPARLYLSVEVLVLAYVVHFGAQALRASQVAVSGVPRRIGDAARSLGASPLRRFVRIDLPLMRPGLAAGGGLVLLSVMKELPATLLLIPTGADTLARRVWFSADSLLYAQAGFFALALVALSAVLTWLLTIRPLERGGRA